MYKVERLGSLVGRFFAAMLAALSAPALGQIAFTDATSGSGVGYTGESWGASWGDYSGDGLTDLFVNHHRSRPGLYLNLGDGVFEDHTFDVDIFNSLPQGDEHGAAWGDYDNDGDQDLLITVGSHNFDQFLVNEGGFLSNHASDFTFDEDHSGGRMPMWFDWTGDGLLDLATGVAKAKFHIHEQVGGDFVRANFITGNQCTNAPYGQLADVTLDGKLDWICGAQSSFPERMYDYTTLPFTDVTSLISPVAATVDSVIADFDGDLDQDMLIVRGRVRVSGAEITGPNSVDGHIITEGGTERGFSFRTSGNVTVEIHWSKPSVSNVNIGASGLHPPAPPSHQPFIFTLSSSDPSVVGIKPHTQSSPTSVYVGYDPGTQTWTYLNDSGPGSSGGGEWSYTYVYFTSTSAVSNVSNINLSSLDQPRPMAFMARQGPSFVDRTAAAGLNAPIPCVAIGAADFDNDMDRDFYVVCRNAVSNAANRLYENLGDGTFALVPGAGGAAGPVGSGTGLSENVVVSDYDADGFVDIFVTNGGGLYPENPYSAGGQDKLFHNVGNGNHWIEIDLVGTQSNRDGIGAIVTASAENGVVQVAEQNGAYHRWAQHDRRIHFGLGVNTEVDLFVTWPSGLAHTFTGVPADHVYLVGEDNTIQEREIGGTPPPSNPSACGQPQYNSGSEQGVFLWRDCPGNAWHLRVTAGGVGTTYGGSVVAEQAFAMAQGFNLEASDELILSPNQIQYVLGVGGAGQDGVDFTTTGNTICFTSEQPSTVPVQIGSGRFGMPLSFDLLTLEPCSNVQPIVSIGDVTVAEDDASGMASFAVDLSVASAQTVTVQYASADGSATAPDDYLAVADLLTFLPGETSQVIDVALIDDLEEEGAETFSITLSNPMNAGLGTSTGTATIQDDDATPVDAWGPAQGGVTTNGNQIVYSGTPTGWFPNTVNSQWFSSLGFTNDFEVRWTIDSNPASSVWIVGLGTEETNADWTDPEFGLRNSNGQLNVRENGTWRINGPILSLGDVISIYVNNGSIEYRHNGVTFYTSSYSGTPDFYVDSSFKTGAIALSVTVAGTPGVIVPPSDTPITSWQGQTSGVTVVGDGLSYSGTPTFWVSTVNSALLSSLGAGNDYTVSWIVGSPPAATTWIVGLSATETNSDWTDIEYGLRSSEGTLNVRQNGTWITNAGQLAAGDELSIHVAGTLLEYQLNGVTFRSATITGTEDFYIDTSFKNGAIDLDSFTLTQ